MVDILIRDDTLDEDTECFTTQLQSSEHTPLIRKFAVCIKDADTVLYTFHQPEYFVYESNGLVTLTLNSSRPIPLEFKVDVDVIDGIGNATGE